MAKIFMAVVAGMFAFSCVTDTTEDLGIEVGKGGGKTQITLSLEESRTQLGEKADGLYPVYWSEGDAIAVNGVISTPLAAEAAGQSSATFQVNGDVAYPYCVVYPASAAATVEEGGEVTEPAPVTAYPVTFANVQPYTVGTFAPQSAPMYAYTVEAAEGEEQLPIQMQHLTGVLRLAVKGDITLASMTVAAEGKIAGLHTVDCTSGVLTADESATNNITVTLPEGGLKLNADVATPIYVAVPAGEHGIYTITLVSDALTDNTMVVRFNSDFHPVVAGVVKEFGEVTFTPNATSGEEGELVIVNAAQMKRLAQLSEVGQLSNVTKVTVGATIDMSDVANWHGIELLPSHITFDGGSDKGYEIKGLKAPLFNSTAATIQNLKLTDVAIVETEQPIVGAIARRFDGTMTNCEAHGTLEMNNTSFTTTANMDKYDVINIGGLVGQAGGATIKDCTNRVDVLVNSIASPEQTKTYVALGGAVGAAHSQASFDNVDNYGTVEIYGGTLANYLRIGGVLGCMVEAGVATPEVAAIKNCDNHGEVFINDKILAEENIGTDVRMGGICGNLLAGVDFNSNNNHAAVHNDGWAGTIMIAGVVGYRNLSDVVNCNNNAPIYNTGRHSFLEIGGIVAEDTYANITNCKNNSSAKLYNTATADEGVTENANVYIGGITGANEPAQDVDVTISGCYNYAEIEHTGRAKAIFLGGIVARHTAAAISNCHNSGAVKHHGTSTGNCYIAGINGISCKSLASSTNSGAVILGKEGAFPAASSVRVVGLVHTVNGPITNCTNSGPVTVNGDPDVKLSALQIGGIAYYSHGCVSNCENDANGDITLNNVKTADVHLAGLVTIPYLNASITEDFENNYNRGDITFNDCVCTATGNTNCRIAGLCALSASTTSIPLTAENQVAWKNCANYGNINFNDFQPGPNSTTKYGRTMVGGCFCTLYAGHFDLENCDNHGEVKLNRLVSNCNIFVGGIISYWGSSAALKNINVIVKDCDNTKDIIVNTKAPATEQTGSGEGFMVGGVIAACYMNTDNGQILSLSNLTNSGDVIVDGNYVSKNASRNCIGGICGDYYTYGTLTNCVNSGAVKFTPDTTSKSTNTHTYIGGVLGWSYPYVTKKGTTLNNCINSGAVEIVNLKMNSSKYLLVGGIVGYEKSRDNIYTYNNCGNSGNILIDNVTSSSLVHVGGMYGVLEQGKGTDKDTILSGENVNIGNLIIKNCSLTGTTMIGGIAGKTAVPVTGAKSYCGIWVPDAFKTKVGWIMGIARADATLASNCGVGGMVITGVDEITDEDGNGDVEVVGYEYTGTAITESDYLSKVYAGTTPAASANEASFLSAKPALPTYTPAE
ncbi:MAG: hypothetical protein IKB90_03545 [Alistipes sp.]|nr:hypothetical protein [Alistipes sp.]